MAGESDEPDIDWDEGVSEVTPVQGQEGGRAVADVKAVNGSNGESGGAVDPSELDVSNNIARYMDVEATQRKLGQPKVRKDTDQQQPSTPRLTCSASRKSRGIGKGAHPNGTTGRVEDTSEERAIGTAGTLCSE